MKKKMTAGEKIEYLLSKIGIKAVYKWILDEDYTYQHNAFNDVDDIDIGWIAIEGDELTIRKGYAWNGCTPKYSFWDIKIIGTFDGPVYYKTSKQKCYYASLVHDALYQFKVLDRKTTNRIFYELLKESEFYLASAYYWAVKVFAHHYKPKKYD